ncbi:uncharacterized protein LOC144915013 [Branchiostoma floridae x Branchiostoma belcheri]
MNLGIKMGMETAREATVRGRLAVAFGLVCMIPIITGVVDVTIVSKYQFFNESDDTWLYCYYTGSLINQYGYQFGVEVDTGSGTRFTPQTRVRRSHAFDSVILFWWVLCVCIV